jgi:hypothetical protein
MTKTNPFEYLNAINSGKDIITHADSPELAEDGYEPFLINKGLSYHLDSVLASNEMNLRHLADKKLQYLYYLYTLKPRKRIAKWHKPHRNDDVTIIQAASPMNKKRAEATLSLLTDGEFQQIQDMMNTGNANYDRTNNKTSRSKASR